MLVLNTFFELVESVSVNNIFEAGVQWISNSPHSLMKTDLATFDYEKRENKMTNAVESFETVKCKSNGKELVGIRYSHNENDEVWRTDVVGVKTEQSFPISVKVSYNTRALASDLPDCKKPYIIRLFSERGWVKKERGFNSAGSPYCLQHDEVDVAASIINGDNDYTLPSVYVSYSNEGRHYVDPAQLALLLSGMANVFVEPNRYFSYDLQRLTGGRNAYNGAVGVYFPKSSDRVLVRPQIYGSSYGIVQGYVFKHVRDILNMMYVPDEFNFSFIRSLLKKVKWKELEKQGKREDNEIIEMYEDEIKDKDIELTELKREILSLKAQLREKSNYAGQGEALLFRGNEADFFQDEIKDVVIMYLEKHLGELEKGSRRNSILRDIIEFNSRTGRREEIINTLKPILRNYKKMNNSIKKKLNCLGLEVDERGSHPKLKFIQSNRYKSPLPATGSDHRGGKNAFSDAIRSLF